MPFAKRATALRSVCDLVWDGVRVCDQGGDHMTITWSGPGVRPASWGRINSPGTKCEDIENILIVNTSKSV